MNDGTYRRWVCGRCPWCCRAAGKRPPEEPPHVCLNGAGPYWTGIGRD